MPKLVVKEGYNRGAIFELNPGKNLLGRDSSNNIQIIEDLVSRSHAQIIVQKGKFVLTDLNSRNGTYVNGLFCQERVLAHTDEIKIGDSVFLFLESKEARRPVSKRTIDAALRRKTLVSPLKAINDKTAPGSATQIAEKVSEPFYQLPETKYIIGQSPPMKEVFRLIGKVAPADSPVLITGESGTGKELVAHAIHSNSARKDKPLVIINCTTLTESLLESELFGHEKGAFTGAIARKLGRLELADQGTVFLDEIGELSTNIQAKLLRALADGKFKRIGGVETIKSDIRIITATNRDLTAAIKSQHFREDLYYRLKVLEIHLAPLREKREDITLLVKYYFDFFKEKSSLPIKEISPEAMDQLKKYHWPGNVRELKNVIEKMTILGETPSLKVSDLPIEIQSTGSYNEASDLLALKALERKHILKALRLTHWNKSQAAELLGISRSTLYDKLTAYKIEDQE